MCQVLGGVIGINGIRQFLGENDARAEAMARHIDYVADLVGSDHVGIGLDYVSAQKEVQQFINAHPETYPPERYPHALTMIAPERMPEIAERLLRGGYSETDVRKIMGGEPSAYCARSVEIVFFHALRMAGGTSTDPLGRR